MQETTATLKFLTTCRTPLGRPIPASTPTARLIARALRFFLCMADTTTCVNTSDTEDVNIKLTSYMKMVSYNTTVPDSGIKVSSYVGTNASTDNCTSSSGVFYQVIPFDTCVVNRLRQWR